MHIYTRLILLIVVIAAGVTAQMAIWSHLEAAQSAAPQQLNDSLAELPLELGQWTGEDREIEDEALLYADQHLQRIYVHGPTGQAVMLWVAFSETGADRGHHPEVCMMVAGRPEDQASRNTLEIAGHAAPVQEYRFGRPGKYQRVFYWHYTLTAPHDNTTRLQRLYDRLHRRPSSMTIEVFAPEQTAESGELSRELVRLIDNAMQPIVGPSARRGSERSPVTYIADT